MERWYVVRTHTHCEAKAKANLQRQGFEVYLPQYTKTRRYARKVENVRAPLFPRYLFVRMDLTAHRWRAVHSSIGVSQLICNGDEPTPVAQGIVSQIKSREDDDGLVVVARQASFKKGQKVLVQAGPFAHMDGVFDCADDKQRVFVFLELLGRITRARIPEGAIQAVA